MPFLMLKCYVISLSPKVVRRTVAMVSSPHCFSCTYHMLHASYSCCHWVEWPPRLTFFKITILNSQVLQLEMKMHI